MFIKKVLLSEVKMCLWLILCVTTFTPLMTLFAQEILPTDLEFRRQAVRRIIFDPSQNIPLSGLYPSKVVGMDVMHPAVGDQLNKPEIDLEGGVLKISALQTASATRWVGAFSPFATYDVAINNFDGSGAVGMLFKDTDADNSITATMIAAKGVYQSARLSITKEGQEIESKDFILPPSLNSDEPIRFRVQMMAVGANLYIELNEKSTLVGRMDFVKHYDLRKKALMRRFEYCLHTELEAKSSVSIDEATAYISPGMGQGDLRAVTYEDGSTYWDNDRLWILVTVRGGGLPHPMQGVYSLNPSVFDIQFEGIILYDRGDDMLRNDLASNIIYDRNAQEWRGFTTGFSSYGDPEKKEKKQIWAVQSTKKPLQGISIMKAKSIGLIADFEDPQTIYDTEARKWRMLLCENYSGYKAVIRESDNWDGPYEIIAGPVTENSTGTQLQMIGNKRYALFGSADRKVYIKTYPDLKPIGELNIHRPPWDDKSGTRIWPNVIPLPDGYPAPYIALMMDRLNFPGMTGSNWTYGAMYLYHGYEKNLKK
ncbi:MAG: hypothetical protein JXR07_10800 [Reichenbachiella sp.]